MKAKASAAPHAPMTNATTSRRLRDGRSGCAIRRLEAASDAGASCASAIAVTEVQRCNAPPTANPGRQRSACALQPRGHFALVRPAPHHPECRQIHSEDDRDAVQAEE